MPFITKQYKFCAAHRYWNEEFSEEKNRKIFGKDIYNHGHNYLLDVTISGPVNEKTGFIINLKELKQILENKVLSIFDHSQVEKDIEDGSHPALARITLHPCEILEVVALLFQGGFECRTGFVKTAEFHMTGTNEIQGIGVVRKYPLGFPDFIEALNNPLLLEESGGLHHVLSVGLLFSGIDFFIIFLPLRDNRHFICSGNRGGFLGAKHEGRKEERRTDEQNRWIIVHDEC